MVRAVHEHPTFPGRFLHRIVDLLVVGRRDGERRAHAVEPVWHVRRGRSLPDAPGATVGLGGERRGHDDDPGIPGEPAGLPGANRAAAEDEHRNVGKVVDQWNHSVAESIESRSVGVGASR